MTTCCNNFLTKEHYQKQPPELFVKKVLLQISQILRENIYTGASFNRVADLY